VCFLLPLRFITAPLRNDCREQDYATVHADEKANEKPHSYAAIA